MGEEQQLSVELVKQGLSGLERTSKGPAYVSLDVQAHGITSIIGDAFRSHSELKHVNFSHNYLSSLEGLQACKNILSAVAAHNNIENGLLLVSRLQNSCFGFSDNLFHILICIVLYVSGAARWDRNTFSAEAAFPRAQ